MPKGRNTLAYVFCFFASAYVVYNAAVCELSEFRELTKWTWCVWTGFYFVSACIYEWKPASGGLAIQTMATCVFSASIVVAIGVCVLIFSGSSMVIEAKSQFGIAAVFIVNYIQHYVPPMLLICVLTTDPALVTYMYTDRQHSVSQAAAMISTVYVYVYLCFMNPDNVYGVTINISSMIPLVFCVCYVSAVLFASLAQFLFVR